jgi:hypothetical protein
VRSQICSSSHHIYFSYKFRTRVGWKKCPSPPLLLDVPVLLYLHHRLFLPGGRADNTSYVILFGFIQCSIAQTNPARRSLFPCAGGDWAFAERPQQASGWRSRQAGSPETVGREKHKLSKLIEHKVTFQTRVARMHNIVRSLTIILY